MSVLQTTHQTAHGQLLDLTTAPPGTTDLSKFTVNNYMRIVTFKTAYYSFYLPVACGMLMAGINQPAAFQTAKEILLIMGQYFQACLPLLHCCVQGIDLVGSMGKCAVPSISALPCLAWSWIKLACVHCRVHVQVSSARDYVVLSGGTAESLGLQMVYTMLLCISVCSQCC